MARRQIAKRSTTRTNRDAWLAGAIAAPLSIEYLLTHLFGKNQYHQFVGIHGPASWRKHLTKVFKTISIAAHQSILGDDFHRRCIEALCTKAMEALRREKASSQLLLVAVDYLTKITFSLVGEFPDHWDNKAAGYPRNWRLNGKRTLVYVRSPEQRVAQILDLTRQDDYRKRLPIFQDMVARLHKLGEFRFLEWFEETYSEVAQELK